MDEYELIRQVKAKVLYERIPPLPPCSNWMTIGRAVPMVSVLKNGLCGVSYVHTFNFYSDLFRKWETPPLGAYTGPFNSRVEDDAECARRCAGL
jgi:hypothetical protein